MKKQESNYGLGIISIFLIFAVLCLTVFAALAVSSARADLRLSEKNADYNKNYYAAIAQCAEFIRQARDAFFSEDSAVISPGIVEGDRVKYDMVFEIDENSRLHAVFAIAADDTGLSAGRQYEVITFEIVTGEYIGEPDKPLNVWQP